jgi:hypothetical protein
MALLSLGTGVWLTCAQTKSFPGVRGWFLCFFCTALLLLLAAGDDLACAGHEPRHRGPVSHCFLWYAHGGGLGGLGEDHNIITSIIIIIIIIITTSMIADQGSDTLYQMHHANSILSSL